MYGYDLHLADFLSHQVFLSKLYLARNLAVLLADLIQGIGSCVVSSDSIIREKLGKYFCDA